MLSYSYTYLLLSLGFLCFWLLLFFIRKDIRREMVFISLVFTLADPISDFIYTQDWWNPITLNNHFFSLEALVTAFSLGGIASVIYDVVFKRKIKMGHKFNKRGLVFKLLLTTVFLAVVFILSFYALRQNSFLATVISMSLITLVILTKRHDLIVDSLLTGILLTAVAVVVYTIVDYVTPGWVNEFWYFKNTPKVVFLNLPLDDTVWYFLAGMWIGPCYEFLYEIKRS